MLNDVAAFNDDFQCIILDIPNISVDEQIDRYTRGLKRYIWKELCTNEYTNVRAQCATQKEWSPRTAESSPRETRSSQARLQRDKAPYQWI